jgi:subtilisin family serine protease
LNVYVAGSASFADSSTNGSATSSHGTHVAGIIGALDNNIGVVGVAPGVRLWSVQVIGVTQAGLANLLAGIDYIAAHADKISVVNASVGGVAGSTSTYNTLRDAIANLVSLGVVFVASAGNSGIDILGSSLTQGSAQNTIPAAIPEVMTISAMDPNPLNASQETNYNFDKIWGGSNYSQKSKAPSFVTSAGLGIDVVGPGVNIYSTVPGSSYATMTGTSMAAAHVSGIVALYIAANGRAHNSDEVMAIRQAIINSGQAQTNWSTAGNSADPDGHREPLAITSENWVPLPALSAARPSPATNALTFNVIPGYTYSVQCRTNFSGATPWTDWTATNGSGAVKPVTLNDSVVGARRFYRLKRQPTP